MAESEQNLENRMWRIEQQQRDLFSRLDKLDGRIEDIEKRQGDRAWRLESVEYRIGEAAKRIDELEKKPPVVVTGAMGDSTVRVIIYGLIAGVVALAGGQAINLTGLLK
jgi:hypothetical protein